MTACWVLGLVGWGQLTGVLAPSWGVKCYLLLNSFIPDLMHFPLTIPRMNKRAEKFKTLFCRTSKFRYFKAKKVVIHFRVIG
jgi:hypothetical protein